MTQDRQLIFLKRLVKTMTILLIGGVIFVFSTAIFRLTSKAKEVGLPGKCMEATQDMMLAQSGDITSMQQEGDVLIIALKENNEQRIVFINLCTGKTLRTIRLSS